MNTPTKGAMSAATKCLNLATSILAGHTATPEQFAQIVEDETQCGNLMDALGDALKTADFERHPARPWHNKARALLAKLEGGK